MSVLEEFVAERDAMIARSRRGIARDDGKTVEDWGASHWFALPKPLRDAIWREYRPGQEHDKKPSARYLAVQRRAIGALLAAPYLLESEIWRREAIEAGDGDPLEGIAS